MASGRLERLTTICKANFNHLLDRMEDPEKMVRQFVRDLEDEVAKAARVAASGLANQRRLEQGHGAAQKRIQDLQERAEAAVGGGDDEKARQVLRDKAAAVAAAAAKAVAGDPTNAGAMHSLIGAEGALAGSLGRSSRFAFRQSAARCNDPTK